MTQRILGTLNHLQSNLWESLERSCNPFTSEDFLFGLEAHGCVGKRFGWHPRHIALYGQNGVLDAVMPLYLKDNGYGELVFDGAWAEAHQRHGLAYYPKLVCAVPYTPITGQRLLVANHAPPDTRTRLIHAALDYARTLGVSSLHVLFPTPDECAALEAEGFCLRLGCQFHWHNHGYRDFDDFLSGLSADKRKKLRRERRQARESGVRIEIRHGDELDTHDWDHLHRFYRDTFERKRGYATLSQDFFEAISHRMGRALVVMIAFEGRTPIACAINFRDHQALYGRHWGTAREVPGLHFECCYYQGIEYCIREGLQRFEPGAQGEHKLARGFLPAPTWSAHWIGDARLRDAIADFCRRERCVMERYMEELAEHSPYRQGD